MKKIFTLLTLMLCVMLFSTTQTKATHVMGSDITWKCLGNDKYEITITVYRDCMGVQLSSASMNILPVNCPGYGTFSPLTEKGDPRDITPVCKKTCTKCSTAPGSGGGGGSPPGSGPGCSEPLGIEAHVFTAEVDFSKFPPSCCEFKISWQQCCRNSTIGTGAADKNFYIESTINRCAKPCDNSPTFTNPPLAIYCLNQPQTFNMGVNDPDVDPVTGNADSLVYSLTDPLDGEGSKIPYNPPYTVRSPLRYDGFPDPDGNWDPPIYKGFHLDSATGDLQFKPTKVEKTVFAIKIQAWGKDKDGKPYLKSETKRDMQIIIIACPNNKPPQLTGINGTSSTVDHFCVDQEKCFTINSFDPDKNDTITVTWNKGIPGASFDIEQKKKQPKGKFCWKPGPEHVRTYPYTFVVNAADDACPVPGRTTRSFRIYVHPTPDVSKFVTYLTCGEVLFQATSKTPGVTFTWSGDAGLKGNGSTLKKQYRDPGLYKYSITVRKVYGNTMCEYTDTGHVIIAPYINARIGNDTAVCIGKTIPKISVKTSLGSNPIPPYKDYKYTWRIGNTTVLSAHGEDSAGSISNILVDKDLTISLEIYDAKDKCYNWDSIKIKAKKPPVPNLGPDVRKCKGEPVLLDPKVSEAKATYKWVNKGTGQVIGTQKTITVNDSNLYEVTVTDSLGCFLSDEIMVKFNPLVQVKPLTVNACVNEPKLISGGTGPDTGTVWEWRDMYASNKIVAKTKEFNFKHTAAGTKMYLVSAKYTYGGVTCSDVDTIIVNIKPKPSIKIVQQIPPQCENAAPLNLGTGNFVNPSNGVWTMVNKPGAVSNNILDPKKAGYTGGIPDTLLYTFKDITTGCENSIRMNILIDKLPEIVLKDTTICAIDGPLNLSSLVVSVDPQNGTSVWEAGAGIQGLIKSGNTYALDPSYPGPVKRTLTYTHKSSTGAQCSSTKSATVTVVPKFNVIAGKYAPLCYDPTTPTSVDLNGSPATGASGPGSVGEWVVAPGTPPAVLATNPVSGKKMAVAFENPGTTPKSYTLVYKYSLDGRCERTDTTTIIVNPKPVVTLSADKNRVCIDGGTVKLIGMVNGSPILGGTYQSEPNTSAGYVAGNNFLPGKAQIGENIIRFTYQDPNTKCSNTGTYIITVDDTSRLKILPVNKTCAGDTIWLEATTYNVKNFAWSSSDATAKFGNKNATQTWFLPGLTHHAAGKIDVKVTADAGADGSVCPVIEQTFNEKLYYKPIPDFTAPQDGCEPFTTQFTDMSKGSVKNRIWDFGDGTEKVYDAQFPVHTYTKPGNYSVTLTAISDKGCVESKTITDYIRVKAKPVADFTATPTYTTITLPRIQFNNLSQKNKFTRFEWDFGDGSVINREENPEYSYKDTGIYTVKLLAIDDSSGCEDEKIAYGYINIRPEIAVYIPNAFTPNRLFNDRTVRNEEFTVVASDYGSFEMTIFNRWGEELYHTTDRLKGWDGTYKGNAVHEGVYIYSVNITSLSGKKYKYTGSITLIR